MNIYESIAAAGFKTDSHESDLYVELTPEFVRHMRENHPNKTYSVFRSAIDGDLWAELPFMFAPFWTRAGAEQARKELRK